MLGGSELILSFVLVLLVKQDSNNGAMLFSLRIELWLATIDYCLTPLESVCVGVCRGVRECESTNSGLFSVFLLAKVKNEPLKVREELVEAALFIHLIDNWEKTNLGDTTYISNPFLLKHTFV